MTPTIEERQQLNDMSEIYAHAAKYMIDSQFEELHKIIRERLDIPSDPCLRTLVQVATLISVERDIGCNPSRWVSLALHVREELFDETLERLDFSKQMEGLIRSVRHPKS